MPPFWKVVNEVLKHSDIIIEVLDARQIEETRNREIENKVEKLGKRILYVMNKCDLVEGQSVLEEAKRRLSPSVLISSTERLGTTLLKKKILEMAQGKKVTVGVVGYPNVGKSSLINALAGREAARTSPVSGFTHGIQKIRVDQKIRLLDTPGVLPYKEKDELKHGLMGAIDYGKVKDAETLALRFIEKEKELVEKFYDVEGEEPEELLEKIALKYKKLRQGGLADLDVTARMVLKDWQTGKMKK